MSKSVEERSISAAQIDKATEIRKLSRYIENNLRAGSKSGIKFIDPYDAQSRFLRNQHHVIFGRRGSGKTSLLTSYLKEHSSPKSQRKVQSIIVNLEEFKDVSFPNIIIKVVLTVLTDALVKLRVTDRNCYMHPLKLLRLRRRIKKTIHEMTVLLSENDTVVVRHLDKSIQSNKASLRIPNSNVAATASNEHESEQEKKKVKIDHLKIQIGPISEILKNVRELLAPESFFIMLDDVYFIPRSIQPDLLDYLHRLVKQHDIKLKIATIKHRSSLFRIEVPPRSLSVSSVRMFV